VFALGRGVLCRSRNVRPGCLRHVEVDVRFPLPTPAPAAYRRLVLADLSGSEDLLGVDRLTAVELALDTARAEVRTGSSPASPRQDRRGAPPDRCSVPPREAFRTVQDIEHAAAFFIAPESGYVTGQVLYVSGGPHG
jgi:NAD(P)-dependent dehydrogenase (short-subunit alcohol dehydrogenase family)